MCSPFNSATEKLNFTSSQFEAQVQCLESHLHLKVLSRSIFVGVTASPLWLFKTLTVCHAMHYIYQQ